MSIINNSYRFIFVHVPKTAGTSVTGVLGALTRYCDQEIGGSAFGEAVQSAYRQRFGLGKHSTALEIKKIVGPQVWSEYFTFGFVRNPYSRCISTYSFLRQWKGGSAEFLSRMSSYASFEEYVLSDIWNLDSQGPDQIFRPQVHWLCAPDIKNTPVVSFIGRLENLAHDLQIVLSTIDAPEEFFASFSVPHLNKSKSSGGDFAFGNPQVVDRICSKYAADFDVFGYSREPDGIDEPNSAI